VRKRNRHADEKMMAERTKENKPCKRSTIVPPQEKTPQHRTPEVDETPETRKLPIPKKSLVPEQPNTPGGEKRFVSGHSRFAWIGRQK